MMDKNQICELAMMDRAGVEALTRLNAQMVVEKKGES